MKKSFKIGAIALGITATSALIAGAANAAYKGKNSVKQRPAFHAGMEKHQAMRGNNEATLHAIENNDYTAWKEAAAGAKTADTITEENFPKFVQMHNLMKEGKFEEANALRQELGFPTPSRKNSGKMPMMRKNNQAAEQAIENNGYAAWKEAVAGAKMADTITEENFPKFVQMHNLMKDGKFDEAAAIAKGLGFPAAAGKRRGAKMGKPIKK